MKTIVTRIAGARESNRGAFSSKVRKNLVDAVVSGGVRRSQVVTDVREQLHPRETGLAFVEEQGWTKLRLKMAGMDIYEVAGLREMIANAGVQRAMFNQIDRSVTVETSSGEWAQEIKVNADGQVVKNVMKVPGGEQG